MGYFVWLPGQKAPEPQIWYYKPVNGNGKPTVTPLLEHKLTELEEQDLNAGRLTLGDLMERYPCNTP